MRTHPSRQMASCYRTDRRIARRKSVQRAIRRRKPRQLRLQLASCSSCSVVRTSHGSRGGSKSAGIGLRPRLLAAACPRTWDGWEGKRCLRHVDEPGCVRLGRHVCRRAPGRRLRIQGAHHSDDTGSIPGGSGHRLLRRSGLRWAEHIARRGRRCGL